MSPVLDATYLVEPIDRASASVQENPVSNAFSFKEKRG
jgi:hypothetical protein